jgi:hypothetical protein
METHRQERDQRDATRKAAWDSSARNDGVNRNLQGMSGAQKKASLADRAKYQFEADSEDDEMENEIDSNLGISSILICTQLLWLTCCRCSPRCRQASQPARPRYGRRGRHAEQAH